MKQEKESLKAKQRAIDGLMEEWIAEDESRAQAVDSIMSDNF